jgi:small subunit ribosomal protein S1
MPTGSRPPREKPIKPGGSPPVLRDFVANKPNNRELDALIEDELNQAMAGFDVAKAVAAVEAENKPLSTNPTGQRRKGRIVGIHGKDVFVEVPGGRSQGVLPLEQFEGKTPRVGDEVEFEIERYDTTNGLLVLTREGAAQVVSDWSSLTPHVIVEARVTGTNKNRTGLTVEVNGIKGFLPASQLDLHRVENLEQYINQRLKVEVVEVNPAERNLIVGRRALLERQRQEQADKFWAEIAEGQVRRGVVKSIKPFGAFVDLGAADGLVPVSEFSWQRVNNLEDFVKIGQEVQVVVSRLDREARKISLSLKQLSPSPWDEYASRVKPGARVTGKVTRIAEFGAFVELAPGVEGLIHISELSNHRVRRVRDVVSEGQSVLVDILQMDPTSRRIALSMKGIAQEAEDAALAAEEAERLADLKAAEELLSNRPVNPNLRGGVGGEPVRFDNP